MKMIIKLNVWFILYLFCSHAYCIEPFERKPEILSGRWQRLGEVDRASTIHLKVALSTPSDDALEERAIKIATPFSGYYRKHMEASELAEWTKPSKTHLDQVLTWLSSHGIQGERNHDLLEAIVPISKAQKLLNTTYYYFHDEDGRVVKRVEEHYVPAHMAQIIDFVHPTVNFPHKRRHTQARTFETRSSSIGLCSLKVEDLVSRSTNPCDRFLTTPACISQFYNVDCTAPANTDVSVENTLSLGHLVNKTNLRIFLEHFNPAAAKAHASFTYHHIGKVYPAVKFADEEDLDMQMILGNGWPVKASYTTLQGKPGIYFWGPSVYENHVPPKKKLHHYEEFYVDYLHSLAHKEFVPAAVTTSEGDFESALTPKYMRYICKIFGQISARGVSALTASGDSGSDGYVKKSTGKAHFEGEWPGTCPFITAVGATVYAKGTEKAVTYETRRDQGSDTYWFASGGGFSQIFPRPKYQDQDIPEYLKDHDLVKKYGNITGFNSTGKGYPDIALFGNKIAGISCAHVSQLAGTSASSPMAAAFIGRLAAYEKSKGRPSLGLLNPWFYKNPQILNDITCCGNNDVNSFQKNPPKQKTGYPVSKGWDAVTGLGSFDFAKMRKSLDDLAAAGALA